GGNPDFLAREAMRKADVPDELIEEATGHAETTDAEILAARKQYEDLYANFQKEAGREHDEVVALGGLHIIGTERHESRRIDNQLRGRSGRQGDPGSTRFYVSLEDDLMQRFGADRVKGLMERLSPDDDVPVEMGMISKQIESAQKRVELHNFEIRKHVLQYDDVMNKQREIIYGERRRVLMGEDLHEYLLSMVHGTLEETVAHYCTTDLYPEEWDLAACTEEVCRMVGEKPRPLFEKNEIEKLKPTDVVERANALAVEAYARKEKEIADSGFDMREIERVVLLRTVDSHWMEHIDAMEQLRQGIGLRAYGQKDPVTAYTHEGFDMFDDMIAEIKKETVTNLLHVQVKAAPVKREQLAKPLDTPNPAGNEPARKGKTVGRNDPCPCGSGKKYKQCHGKQA
ncbi:SEC-C domain-containing protein, partial [Christensenellaceae bacterium OttesenSCG-928-L17]|nr:SEC-C domain-containing protein [Christensenellaceae bacterium OttesenSCG-928-L17]